MVDWILVSQIGLPDGVAGHENEALTWVGPGPQDYELAPANAGSVEAVDITDSTSTGRNVLTAASQTAARTALGGTTVGQNVFAAADQAAGRTAIGAGTSSLVLGTTAGTALAGDTAFTKTTVGLANVDNTSDTAKPVSTLQAASIAAAQAAAIAASVPNTGNTTVAGIKTFSSPPVVPDATFTIAKTTGLQAALDARALESATVHKTGNETVAGIKTFSSIPGVPDDSFAIAKTVGLQTALDAKISTTAEIAEADLTDDTDVATGLITGRRMQVGVDAYTGGVETIFWDSGSSSWPDARDSATKWIFDSKGYPAATPPVGHSVHDEWWKDPA